MKTTTLGIPVLLLSVTAGCLSRGECAQRGIDVGRWIDNATIAPHRRQEALLAIADRLPYMPIEDRCVARMAVSRRILLEDVVVRRLLALIAVASTLDGHASTESMLQRLREGNGVEAVMVLQLLEHRGVDAVVLAHGIEEARFGSRLDDMVSVETSMGWFMLDTGWDIEKSFCRSYLKLAGSAGVTESGLRRALRHLMKHGTRDEVEEAMVVAEARDIGDAGKRASLKSALDEAHGKEMRLLLDAFGDSLE